MVYSLRMSDTPIEPIENASAEQIILKRGFMVHRLRETQPGLNQAAQDSIPGAGSGDQ